MRYDTDTWEDEYADGYDDGNIPEIDLPDKIKEVEPLPESSRPRRDGPGGEDGE